MSSRGGRRRELLRRSPAAAPATRPTAPARRSVSAAATAIPHPAGRVSRTRSASAPVACSDTPARRTADGASRPGRRRSTRRPAACSAASSSAGCRPNRRAASPSRAARPRRTPRRRARHTARSPGTPGRSRSRPRPAARRTRRRADRARRRRRPRASQAGRTAPVARAATACRSGVPGPGAVGVGSPDGSRPVSAGARPRPAAPTRTCTCTAAPLGQHQRRLEDQLLEPVAADLRRRPDRQLDERRAGHQHRPAPRGRPATAARTRQPAGEHTALASSQARPRRPSSGWSAAPSPARRHVARPHATASGQYRSRWKAYVGSSTVRRTASRRTRAPSRPCTPWTCSSRRGRSDQRGHLVAVRRSSARNSTRVGTVCSAQRGQHAVRARPPGTWSPRRCQRAGSPSANRTASRTCRTQYSGDRDLGQPAPSHSGHDRDRAAPRTSDPSATAANSASIGSISGEWNACDTRSRVVLRPRLAQLARPAPAPRLVAGDHHRAGTVDRRDTRPRRSAAGTHLVLGGLDRHHRATGGQRLHQPAPRRHQRARVRQRQHPGHVRGRHLTDRMPHQRSPGAHPTTPAAGTAPPRPRTTPAGCTRLVEHRAVAVSDHTRTAGPGADPAQHTPRPTPRRTPGTPSYSSRPMPSRCEP